MKVLLIHANPNSDSFTKALQEEALKILTLNKHEVQISDLYEDGFNPIATGSDVGKDKDKELHYMMDQRDAMKEGAISKDILKEQKKIQWAEMIILHYPIWWFSPPAILKGWFDRVFSLGFAWDFGAIYESGLLKGKKAMVTVTTGGPKDAYERKGMHKATMQDMLHPVNWGVLKFCGMDVLPPFIAWTVFQAGDEGRKKFLEEYGKIIDNIEVQKLLY